jgi:hypothetical protein
MKEVIGVISYSLAISFIPWQYTMK